MKISWLLISAVIIVFSCTSNSEKEENTTQKKGLFARYLYETFENEFKEKTYFIIIGKRICQLCERGTLSAFKLQQNKIISDKITLVTDFKKEDIDTLLNESFNPHVLIDSTSNFENYMFPRSYITIYKIINGEVESHVYFSEDKKLNQFLLKEDLRNRK